MQVNGRERGFHINSRNFDNEELNWLAETILELLRVQDVPLFFNHDTLGNKRYTKPIGDELANWQALLA